MAVLALHHPVLVLLLDHISAITLLETETLQLPLAQFGLPLVTGEVLMWLLALRTEPPSAHHTLKTCPFLDLPLLEDLFAAGSRAEEVLLVT